MKHKKVKNNILSRVSFFCSLLSTTCCLLLITTSCSIPQKLPLDLKNLSFEKNYEVVKIYFTKFKGTENIFLIPVTRKIPKENSILDSSLRELFLGPTKNEEFKGVMTEIPIGTRLINISESEDEVLINLSSQYLTGGGAASMQVRYLQLYRTLKNIVPGKNLYLQVEGKEVKTIGGEGVEITQPLKKINDYTKKYEKIDSVQP